MASIDCPPTLEVAGTLALSRGSASSLTGSYG